MQNSKAYGYLIEQLNAVGWSEKKDGYYPRIMEEIYDWERDEVEDIIWKVFREGRDGDLAIFLPKLKKYDGIGALKEALAKCRIPSSRSVLYSHVLYDATGDEDYLDLIKRNIDASPDTISYVSKLLYCKPSPKLYNILSDIYINNNNAVNRYTAVQGILYIRGLINDIFSIQQSSNTREMCEKFRSKDREERKSILERFEKGHLTD